MNCHRVWARTKELWLVAVSAHANYNGLASIGTPYLVTRPPCCVCSNNLIDMKGWCLKSEHQFVDIRATSTTTHLTKKQHFRDRVFSLLFFFFFLESDIINRNKCINELHLIRLMIVRQTIINHWNNTELQDILLGDCAMAFPSHVVDDFIPEKICRMKNIHWNLFPHFDAI